MGGSRSQERPLDPSLGSLSLVSLHRFLEPMGPLGECREEAAQPLAGFFIHEVACLRIELLAREGDEYLRFGHHVGRGLQEYLPQDHLSTCRPAASRACPHDPDRFVAEGRGVVTRTQSPVQGGGQDARNGVVVLGCCYEHSVIGAYLLPKLFHRLRDALVLYVLVEVGYAGEVEALATHPLRSHLVRCPHDATVKGGSPEASGEAEYAEISMIHCLSSVGVLDPDHLSSRPIIARHSQHLHPQGRIAQQGRTRRRRGYLSLARLFVRPVLQESVAGPAKTPAMLRDPGACREDRGTYRILDQVDGYDAATVTLALAARTAAARVAVS